MVDIFMVIKGVLTCLIIGFFSIIIDKIIPIGSFLIAIILGVITKIFFKIDDSLMKGVSFSEKYTLPSAIALMGCSVDFSVINMLGYKIFVLIVFSIFLTIFLTIFFSYFFKIGIKLAFLLGVGNAICGSSAIAAVKPIVNASEQDAGIAIVAVSGLGIFGFIALPLLSGYILKFSDFEAGFLLGNTLQSIGHVAAAGALSNDLVLKIATIIKMGRIIMLFPIVFILYFFIHKFFEIRKL